MKVFKVPCTYQGGKSRLASVILEEIDKRVPIEGKVFCDVCSGSGAITLESLNYKPKQNIMIDSGCMGRLWQSISNRTFDVDYFTKRVENLPPISGLQSYLQQLSGEIVNPQTFIYGYLLLQAGAFGGKEIWIEGNNWCNTSFRNYWLPTESSNRKSPVNPMMPMPETILSRVKDLLDADLNITVYTDDLFDTFKHLKVENMIVYIDPPYVNTTGYHAKFSLENLCKLIKELNEKNISVFVSEGICLNEAETVVFGKRNKGNISGKKSKEPVTEVLNCFVVE